MFSYDFVEDLNNKTRYAEILADEVTHEHPYEFVVIVQVPAQFVQVAYDFGKSEAPVD